MEELISVLSKRLDDHDILVKLATQQENLINEVRQNNKLASESRDDHEQRLRELEARINWLWGAIGLGMAGSFAAAKFF